MSPKAKREFQPGDVVRIEGIDWLPPGTLADVGRVDGAQVVVYLRDNAGVGFARQVVPLKCVGLAPDGAMSRKRKGPPPTPTGARFHLSERVSVHGYRNVVGGTCGRIVGVEGGWLRLALDGGGIARVPSTRCRPITSTNKSEAPRNGE